jgi:hypothetical protein
VMTRVAFGVAKPIFTWFRSKNHRHLDSAVKALPVPNEIPS